MNLKILKKYNIKAKKSLWQNFLINEDILEFIANYNDIKWKNIIEVWPWYGALTEKLLKQEPVSLNLVELDKNMVAILQDRIKSWDLNIEWINFSIENIDVLKFKLKIPLTPFVKGGIKESYKYFVIANIPYYITSPILRHFLYEVENIPEKMIILMQEDVWNKILKTLPPTPLLSWGEGSKKVRQKSSVLWLFVAKKCFVKEIIKVPKENFIPAPKVESSVLLFEKHNLYEDIDDEKFIEFVKIWFAEPRKKMIKNLIKWNYLKDNVLWVFDEMNLKEDIRWEDLNISDWVKLFNKLN